jgi:hypothetical protein
MMQQESNLKNAYLEAYRIACEKLLDLDAETVCQNSKASYDKVTSVYTVQFFGQACSISCADRAVLFDGDPVDLTTTEKILILHYLINARPKALTGKNISFKEVPNGGSIYYSTFKKRAIDPLVQTFSEDLPGFKEAIRSMRGSEEKYGDASATIHVFPFVPVTYVLWKGDEEVQASGTILFDSSIEYFLPVEDVVLAASFGAYRMIGVKNKMKG